MSTLTLSPMPVMRSGLDLLAWSARVTRWGFARLWVYDALLELGDPADAGTDRDLSNRIARAAEANRQDIDSREAAWRISVDRSLLELPIPEDWLTTGEQLVDVLVACWVAWIEDQLAEAADICGWWPEGWCR